jgi:hypothetical protein
MQALNPVQVVSGIEHARPSRRQGRFSVGAAQIQAHEYQKARPVT